MKKGSIVLIFIMLLLVGCSAGNEEEYETIEIGDVQQLQDDGKIVLDVREVEEFSEGHIVGAVNLPLSELKEDNFAELDKSESYIVICRSGNRSIEASDILSAEGFDVLNVSEGMSSWTGEVER